MSETSAMMVPMPVRVFAGWLGCVALFVSSAVAARDRVSVDVTSVTTAATAQPFTLSGTLAAVRRAGLSPRIDGLVARVIVDAGDTVTKGQLLLALDDTQARLAQRRLSATRSQAEAQRAEAARLVAEAEPLVAQRSFPATELSKRRAALALAEAELRAALAAEREQAEAVARHHLRAPFAGVIARRTAEAGEWVSRGTPVLDLVDLSSIRLEVKAPQERFADLAREVAVTIEPDVAPGTRVPARIAARVPVADDGVARTFLLRVVADDPPLPLLPGTSARARFEITRDTGGMLIPRDALLRHPDGGHSVFVVEGSGSAEVVRRRPVELGPDAGDSVEIREGLSAGERVVVRGNEVLDDGQAVTVRTPGPGN